MTRVLYLGTRTVLDPRSGGAIELRTVLETLAAAGFEAHSVSMTLFDAEAEFPLERLVGPAHAGERFRGCLLEAEHRGVCHHLFRTAGTRERDLAPAEAKRFVTHARRILESARPDIVLTSGGNVLSRALHELARECGDRVVFYLANPNYERAEPFAGFDAIWCPTGALAAYYRERLGIEAEVFPTVIGWKGFADPDRHGDESGNRRYITMVNPAPDKGGMLFLRLAQRAARERPDLRFLAVEGRVTRAQWRRVGVDPDALPNLDWVRNRFDMRPVYRRSALVLFPSLCFEAAGRVPVEAQLSGIPVLATDRGGIAEQLNGGGSLFEPPPASLADYLAVPAAARLRPWLERIKTLMDDASAYTAAARAARAAVEPFHPRHRQPRVVETFRRLAARAAGD